MAITAFTGTVNGLWPLGKITVAAAGTAVNLNVNVGAQTETLTSAPTRAVRQLIFMCPTTGNTGLIYILRKVVGQTVSKTDTGFVVGIIGPGQSLSLPGGSLAMSAALNPDDYSVDADTSANVVFATAVTG